MNRPYQKFTKDVRMVALTNLLIALKNLLVLPIITKLLGIENYGIWAQIIVTISLIVPVATLGLPYTLVRFLAAEKKEREIREGVYSVLSLIFIVTLIISLFLLFFSGPISNFWGGGAILVKILAFIIIFECLNIVFLHVFRAFQEIYKYSFFMILQTIGEIGLMAAAILLNYGLFGAVSSLLIVRIVIFLITGVMIFKKIGLKIPNFSKITEYLSFGLPTIPGNISSWIIHSSDRYLISYLLGVLFVGYYTPAYTIGNSLLLFVSPLSFILPAILSKLFDENKIKEVKFFLKYSLKYFLLIAIPSVFGLSILSKQLLEILSTPEIAEQSYYIVPFIAFSVLLFGIHSVIIQILALKKKTQIMGTIWSGAAFLNLGLNLLLIPKFGILGAAITTLLAYTSTLILSWYYSFQKLRFEIDLKFVFKSIFASMLTALFIAWFNPTGLTKTIIAILLGALIYGILMFLLKGINKKEINLLKGLLKVEII